MFSIARDLTRAAMRFRSDCFTSREIFRAWLRRDQEEAPG